jgi:hypothetical protein
MPAIQAGMLAEQTGMNRNAPGALAIGNGGMLQQEVCHARSGTGR